MVTCVKGQPCKERKLQGATHGRTGPQNHCDSHFVKTLGVTWRDELDECRIARDWRAGSSSFVNKVCKLLSLLLLQKNKAEKCKFVRFARPVAADKTEYLSMVIK